MKQGPILLSGLAWLQLTAAACCRSNKCLKAIVSSGLNGIQDCSANLAVTITPTQSTITETITQLPTEHNTFVHTAVFTETVTTIAETETQHFTIQSTVTDSTYTQAVASTQTLVVTQTVWQTATGSPSAIYPLKARDDTLLAPEPEPSTVPEYASEHCPSWVAYVKACKCVGVEPTTVTAEAPSATTVTISYTADPITVSVPTTLSVTDTVYVSFTETVAATDIETVLVTATTKITQTAAVESTVTVTRTTTSFAPAATCKAASEVAPFKAQASAGGAAYQLYADFASLVQGNIDWQAPSSSTSLAVKNRYIWKIDSAGYLVLANTVPGYTAEFVAWVSLSFTGTTSVMLRARAQAEYSVAAGSGVKLKVCVNSVTGELTVDGGLGRRNLLRCGTSVSISAGDGSDIRSGGCPILSPKIVS